MLNFMVTEEGLEDQMLSTVMKSEENKMFEKRNNCIVQKADNEKIVTELQEKILNKIAGATGNLLEDDELVATLDQSKSKCKEVEQELETMKNTMKNIEGVREIYRPVAKRVARLFFVLSDLSNVDPMYQYSIKWFDMIYRRSFKKAEASNDKTARIMNITKTFTKLLYKNVCRSLFEKDKLLFSFLLAMKIMEEKGELNVVESRFLMTGGSSVEMPKPNPTGASGWLSDKAWMTIIEFSKNIEAFHGFDTEFVENLESWERIYNSAIPHKPNKEAWPGKWGELPIFKRLIILRTLRPDKIVPSIQKLIKHEKDLGKQYIMPPTFDLGKSFKDSQNDTPIIFVLSPGADPMSELKKLAENPNMRKKYESLSLGQGQDKKAINAINVAKESGSWVVL
jgi:dynein heavy chain